MTLEDAVQEVELAASEWGQLDDLPADEYDHADCQDLFAGGLTDA